MNRHLGHLKNNMKFKKIIIVVGLFIAVTSSATNERRDSDLVRSLSDWESLSYVDQGVILTHIGVIERWLLLDRQIEENAVEAELQRILKGREVRDVLRMAELAKLVLRNSELLRMIEIQTGEARTSLNKGATAPMSSDDYERVLKFEKLIDSTWHDRKRPLPKLELKRSEKDATSEPWFGRGSEFAFCG